MPKPADSFLVELDSMVESTEEFLGDDTSAYDLFSEKLDVMVRGELKDRLQDLLALEHVRKLYVNVFQTQGGDGGERAHFESYGG